MGAGPKEFEMTNWQNFFFLCGSSAAGLAAVMFMVVTFGEKLIKPENEDQVDAFFSTLAIHFYQVFILSCVGCMPGLDFRIVGGIIAVSALYRLSGTPKIYRTLKKSALRKPSIKLQDWLISLVFPFVIYVVLLVDAELFYRINPFAPYVLAFSLIVILILAMRGAWEMLLWTAVRLKATKEK
jgi:hypothetical protein